MSLPRIGPEVFDGVRLRRAARVAVAFLADWCPFCAEFEPGFAKLAQRSPADFLVADVTSYESPLWERFGIDTVPTVVVFQDGEEVWREDGIPGEGLDPAALERVAESVEARSSPRESAETAPPPPSRAGRPGRSAGGPFRAAPRAPRDRP